MNRDREVVLSSGSYSSKGTGGLLGTLFSSLFKRISLHYR